MLKPDLYETVMGSNLFVNAKQSAITFDAINKQPGINGSYTVVPLDILRRRISNQPHYEESFLFKVEDFLLNSEDVQMDARTVYLSKVGITKAIIESYNSDIFDIANGLDRYKKRYLMPFSPHKPR